MRFDVKKLGIYLLVVFFVFGLILGVNLIYPTSKLIFLPDANELDGCYHVYIVSLL